MRVSPKALERHIGTESADGAMEQAKCAGRHGSSDWIMSNDKEKVNWLRIVDCIQEPLLLNHSFRWDDFRHVGIARKIEENAKSHDPKAWINRQHNEPKSRMWTYHAVS